MWSTSLDVIPRSVDELAPIAPTSGLPTSVPASRGLSWRCLTRLRLA
jgi:hypothetical protein